MVDESVWFDVSSELFVWAVCSVGREKLFGPTTVWVIPAEVTLADSVHSKVVVEVELEL